MTTDERDFVWLAELLAAGEPAGVLAQAIEAFGVQGTDRFGRFVTFNKNESECEAALDALAVVYRWQCGEGSSQMEPSPLDDALVSYSPGNPLQYGWIRTDLPNFSEISRGVTLTSEVNRLNAKRGGIAKGQRMDLLLVGAMYQFIKGDISKQCHPNFENQHQFANLLDDKFAGCAGRAGSLVKKLKEAEEALNDALQGAD